MRPSRDEEVLLVEQKADLLVATLNRPRKANALSVELILAIGALVKELSRGGRYSDTKAVVITGSGQQAFSAGADIHNLAGQTESSATAHMRTGQIILNSLEDSSQVIIAAINGVAFGGGLELAMACDIRIASPASRFGQLEITLGNLPGWGGTQRLPRLIGEGRALELILTGDQIDAHRAQEMGLVNSIAVDPLSAAQDLAARIARMSPTAVAAAKRAVYTGVRSGISSGLETEATLVGKCSISPEQRAAVQAFFDRKKLKSTTRGL